MSTNQPDVSLLGKIAGYTEILAKDPRSTIFVPLCEAYRQMGMLDDALEIALNGVRTLPSFSPGYAALGRIHAQRGDREEAIAAFEKALETDAENVAALRGLARIRLEKSETEKAGGLLRRLVALIPDDAAAQKMLAGLEKASSRRIPEEKGSEIKTATAPPSAKSSRRAGEPISTPTIAEIYIKQGFPKRAMKVYRDLLSADPHNDMIRRKLIELKRQIDGEASAEPKETSDAKANAVNQAVQPVGEGAASGGSKGYGETLTSWLDSIRRRREHVQ